jgi:hypothetical protein
MQRIEVPGIGIVEFPDGMSDDAISKAIQANMPQEKAAPKMGVMETLMIGAGKKTDDILNGLAQLALIGEPKAQAALAAKVAEGQRLYQPVREQRPVISRIGEALPALAVPGGASSYAGAMGAAALPELASYGSAQERLARGGAAAAGGAVGRALGGAVSSVLKPSGVGTTVSREATDAAKRIGYKPLAGQATQNPAMLNVENYLARNPGSSGTMAAINEANQKALNRAAAKAIGQNADDLGTGVLKAAENTIGGEFQRLQEITAPRLGNEFVDALVKIEQSNVARGAFRDKTVDSVLDKALDLAAQGNLSGKAYKEIRTELSNQATRAFKNGDATLGQAVKSIREALDEAAQQSLSKADQEAWKVARKQWGNWKALTKGLVAEGGNVSAARVAGQLRSGSPGFRTGDVTGPLADVGRIGETFKGALNPNSGNQVSMMVYGNPITGIPATAANFTAAKVYTSPLAQWYLRNGLLDIGQGGESLLQGAGVPIGVGGMNSLLGSR